MSTSGLPPAQDRDGHNGGSPAKGRQDSYETGVSLLGGKAERAATAQPGEEKALQGDLSHQCMQASADGAMLFLVVPSARTRGNTHRLEHRSLSEHKEMLFPL